LNFSLEVENLKSDEKDLDKNAYKAMKTKEFKEIFYQLVWSKVIHELGNKYLIKTHGNLTIAGITRAVNMNVSCIVNNDSTITCTGSQRLKMSDYKIHPPSFMMGAMKTGDAVTLDFIFVYKKENLTDKLF
jgi:polyisoprenoid-binding protein YceI